MNAKELAEKLNGMEYPVRIPDELKSEAVCEGLVIVVGGSDDLMLFYGFFDDDVDCYNGGTFKLDKEGFVRNECDNATCPYFGARFREAKNKIEAVWNDGGYCWTYETEIPHETFDVWEEGEKYCKGIVFRVDDLK